MTLSKPFNILSSLRIQNIITVCTVMFIFFGAVSCQHSYNLPDLNVLPLEETYNQAENIAIDWQPDAQLNSASFDIELSSFPESMNCNYVFLSPTSRNYLIIFMKADKSGYHIRSTEDAWPEDRPIGQPINFEEINLESNEALQAIIGNGGSTFFERYQIREKRGALDLYSLNLERLDEYKGEGAIIWTGGFDIDSPHAQLYMSIEDTTGDLLKVTAYGEQEQEYWLQEIIVRDKISIGDSKNFFDNFDVQLDKITEENTRRYADFTIISPKTPWLIFGKLTHKQIKPNSIFPFGDYEIKVVKIGQDWMEIEVMPIVRWYKPTPEN
jgi:hypothetical protein